MWNVWNVWERWKLTGPDYYIPSNQSLLTKDEVISYAGLVAIFRSSWWYVGIKGSPYAQRLIMIVTFKDGISIV